jgi:hypothetical protein
MIHKVCVYDMVKYLIRDTSLTVISYNNIVIFMSISQL